MNNSEKALLIIWFIIGILSLTAGAWWLPEKSFFLNVFGGLSLFIVGAYVLYYAFQVGPTLYERGMLWLWYLLGVGALVSGVWWMPQQARFFFLFAGLSLAGVFGYAVYYTFLLPKGKRAA